MEKRKGGEGKGGEKWVEMGRVREGNSRGREGGRDCAVLKFQIPFKKPGSLTFFETDRRPCSNLSHRNTNINTAITIISLTFVFIVCSLISSYLGLHFMRPFYRPHYASCL